jgi:hypothetical protein
MTQEAWSTLDNNRIISGIITIPYYGAIVADLVLANTSVVSDQPTLIVGNLTIKLTVVRQASFAGSRSFRLVGGYGGWRQHVSTRYYQNDSGILLKTVVNDAALEVGEKMDVSNITQLLGAQYVRFSAPASRVLDQLSPDWWITPDGITHLGKRNNTPITSPSTVITYSGGKGKFEVATEDLASWLPGRTFISQNITDPQTIGSTSISMDNEGKVRLEVLNTPASNPQDRLSDPLTELVMYNFPNLYCYGIWECSIINVSDSITGPWSLDVQPIDPASPLPGMVSLTYYPSLQGAKVKPTLDTICLVGFINADPQRPYIHSFDANAADRIDIGIGEDILPVEDSTRVIVRYGDLSVQLGMFKGPITTADQTNPPIPGTISKVKA